MATDKALDQMRYRAKLHMLQRCINVEEYLSQHWEEFENLVAALKRKKGEDESCALVQGLMDAQSSSVPADFEGPLMHGNMASNDLNPRTVIFGSEFVAANLLSEAELDILYSSVVDQLDELCVATGAVRKEVGALHALIAKLIVLMEGQMNLTDNDWGLIHDAITWELELLPLHQTSDVTPRKIRLRRIQQLISEHLNYD